MPRIEPPSELVLPSRPYNDLSQQEKLDFLHEELTRATQLVSYYGQLTAKNKEIAANLMEDEPPTPPSRRARELIIEAEHSLGLDDRSSNTDALEERRATRILLGRRLVASSRVMLRDSYLYRWRIAQRLAEVEAEGGD